MTAKFSLARGLEVTQGLLYFLVQFVPRNIARIPLTFMNGANNLADGPHDCAARTFCLGAVTHQEHEGSSGVGRTRESVNLGDRNPQT